ncbi:MAG TPA: 1-(5-phosphoribosyl)-5-[(5-phosphoribosylamino)methylideneamino]imidazole-4-carboxamide isomerase [Fimbriimonas sp.]
MQILPSIDLLSGRTVRLLHGDYSKETAYAADPVETALSFEEQGASVIHVVDLDGARSGVIENGTILQAIFRAVKVPVEVGGGVRTIETAQKLLDQGCARVVFGTALVRDPELAERAFRQLGAKAVAGIDARDGKVAVAGWIDQSEIDAFDLARRMQDAGCRRLILTDIARDGALSGPNVAMLRRFADGLEIPVVASGGVSRLEDVHLLASTNVEGAIIGRAIYEQKFTVAEAVAAAG